MFKRNYSPGKEQKPCFLIIQLQNFQKSLFYAKKKSRNDFENLRKLYTKIYLKRLKNEFLMNILLGLVFLYTL